MCLCVCGFIQIKHKQDEEKRQLCSLRDQLRPALQPEFKEVKIDTLFTLHSRSVCTHMLPALAPAQIYHA